MGGRALGLAAADKVTDPLASCGRPVGCRSSVAAKSSPPVTVNLKLTDAFYLCGSFSSPLHVVNGWPAVSMNAGDKPITDWIASAGIDGWPARNETT